MDDLLSELMRLDELQVSYLDEAHRTVVSLCRALSSLYPAHVSELSEAFSLLSSDIDDTETSKPPSKRKRSRLFSSHEGRAATEESAGSGVRISARGEMSVAEAEDGDVDMRSCPQETATDVMLIAGSESRGVDESDVTKCNVSDHSDFMSGVTELRNRFTANASDVQKCLGRVSRLVDSCSGGELSSVIAPTESLSKQGVNNAVLIHLRRSVPAEVACNYRELAGLDDAVENDERYDGLLRLLESFRAGTYQPIIDWARSSREPNSVRQGSDLSAAVDARERSDLAHFPPSSSTVPVDEPTVSDMAGVSLEDSNNANRNDMEIHDNRDQNVSAMSTSSSSASSLELGADHGFSSTSNSSPTVSARHVEFCLHRLEYLRMLQHGERNAALEYARKSFAEFMRSYLSEVQQLMACLVYLPDLSQSPYGKLVGLSHIREIERSIALVYCRIEGLPIESMLQAVVRCGASCLPVLLKASRVGSTLRDRATDDVLPVEVEIGRDCQHHSIFICPVSREEAIDDGSVPMILPCGHVLSKQSVNRLPRGGPRFKCPYCPMEQSQSDCKPICF